MQQFYSDETVQRIVEDEGDEVEIEAINRPFRTVQKGAHIYPLIKKDDLKGDYDFIVASLSTMAASKELKRKNNVDILDRMPTAGEGVVDKRAVWGKVFEDMDWEPSMFILPDQSAPPPPTETPIEGGEQPPAQPDFADILLGLGKGNQPPNAKLPLTSGQTSGKILANQF